MQQTKQSKERQCGLENGRKHSVTICELRGYLEFIKNSYDSTSNSSIHNKNNSIKMRDRSGVLFPQICADVLILSTVIHGDGACARWLGLDEVVRVEPGVR